MIGQCFLPGPSRGGRGKTVKPEISSQQLSVLFHRRSQAGAKAGNACFKISLPATNRCASSFTTHLEARKGKKFKVCPQNWLK